MADQQNPDLKEAGGAEAPSPKAKRGKKGLILLIGGLFLLITTGSILFFVPSLLPGGMNPFKKGGEGTEERKPEEFRTGHLYNLESMIVNLADTESPRYLKIKIDLESDASKPEEEFNKRLPQLKDAILTLLTSKTYSDISEPDGKLKLKEEIALKANELFEKFKVKKVYFTEFVVQ